LNTILKGESRNRQRIFIFSNDHHLEWRMGHNIEMGKMFSFKTTVAVGTKLYRNGV
jgi:hypothetical protein